MGCDIAISSSLAGFVGGGGGDDDSRLFIFEEGETARKYLKRGSKAELELNSTADFEYMLL